MRTPLGRTVPSLARKILRRLPESYTNPLKAYVRGALGSTTIARGLLRSRKWAADECNTGSPNAGNSSKSADRANPLESFFDSRTAGRGIIKWRHYFDIYHRHFSKFTGKEVHLLEVGVYSGGSLEMWKDYFGPKCQVYGVDIQQSCKAYEDDRAKIFIGDQADRNFWKRVRKDVPKLDIVIDDGGHQPDQQIATLEETFPHLQPGGVYVCEDVHGTYNPFADYVSGLSHNLNTMNKPEVNQDGEIFCVPTEFQSLIQSVHLYPYVVVIEKARRPFRQLVCEKRGTQWEPLL